MSTISREGAQRRRIRANRHFWPCWYFGGFCFFCVVSRPGREGEARAPVGRGRAGGAASARCTWRTPRGSPGSGAGGRGGPGFCIRAGVGGGLDPQSRREVGGGVAPKTVAWPKRTAIWKKWTEIWPFWGVPGTLPGGRLGPPWQGGLDTPRCKRGGSCLKPWHPPYIGPWVGPSVSGGDHFLISKKNLVSVFFFAE